MLKCIMMGVSPPEYTDEPKDCEMMEKCRRRAEERWA
jgi:hypothetical protein